MNRKEYRTAKKALAFWGMVLFLGIYVFAIPFHSLLENHDCHDTTYPHGTDCPLCALADVSIETSAVGLELPLLICVLLQIIFFTETPLISFPSLVPHSRAPPVA